MSCLASKKATDDLTLLRDVPIDFVVTKGPESLSMPAGTRTALHRYRCFCSQKEFQSRRLNPEGSWICGRGQEPTALADPEQVLSRGSEPPKQLRRFLDVHHRIPPWYWGEGIKFADVQNGAENIVVSGGGELPCASSVDNLLISALHIVSDKNHPGWNLMAWRDFIQLAHTADPFQVVKRARESHLCGWINWIIEQYPPPLRPTGLVHVCAGAKIFR